MNLDFLNRPQLEARVRAAEHDAGRRFVAGLLIGIVLGMAIVSTILVVATMAGAQ